MERFFRGPDGQHAIKDELLDTAAEQVERRKDLSTAQTRQMIQELVLARCTLPE